MFDREKLASKISASLSHEFLIRVYVCHGPNPNSKLISRVSFFSLLSSDSRGKYTRVNVQGEGSVLIRTQARTGRVFWVQSTVRTDDVESEIADSVILTCSWDCGSTRRRCSPSSSQTRRLAWLQRQTADLTPARHHLPSSSSSSSSSPSSPAASRP